MRIYLAYSRRKKRKGKRREKAIVARTLIGIAAVEVVLGLELDSSGTTVTELNIVIVLLDVGLETVLVESGSHLR